MTLDGQLFKLQRNDLRGAVRLALDYRARGELTLEILQMLAALQDDPRQLFQAIAARVSNDDVP